MAHRCSVARSATHNSGRTRIKRISIVGVIVGGITDILSTAILGVPFTLWVLLEYLPNNTPPNQYQTAIVAVVHGNALLLVVQWMLGGVCSILGGYVAAWIAKHDELLNGTLSSWLCILVGIGSVLTPKPPIPIYVEIVALVASPLSALLGGWIRLVQRARRARVAIQATE